MWIMMLFSSWLWACLWNAQMSLAWNGVHGHRLYLKTSHRGRSCWWCQVNQGFHKHHAHGQVHQGLDMVRKPDIMNEATWMTKRTPPLQSYNLKTPASIRNLKSSRYWKGLRLILLLSTIFMPFSLKPQPAHAALTSTFLPSKLELELCFRLFYASFVGGLVGLERSTSDRPAGVRTMALVSLGAASFTLVSTYGFAVAVMKLNAALVGLSGNAGGVVFKYDPSRLASNVASGVGFIGAGVITHKKQQQHQQQLQQLQYWQQQQQQQQKQTQNQQKKQHLQNRQTQPTPASQNFIPAPPPILDHTPAGGVGGLTTAAAIWVAASVGVAAGVGMYFASGWVSLCTIAILRIGKVKRTKYGLKSLLGWHLPPPPHHHQDHRASHGLFNAPLTMLDEHDLGKEEQQQPREPRGFMEIQQQQLHQPHYEMGRWVAQDLQYQNMAWQRFNHGSSHHHGGPLHSSSSKVHKEEDCIHEDKQGTKNDEDEERVMSQSGKSRRERSDDSDNSDNSDKWQ